MSPIAEADIAANGNGAHTAVETPKVDNGTTTPAPPTTNKWATVHGPLGLESASLAGKVALVTGSGKVQTHKTKFRQLMTREQDEESAERWHLRWVF